MIVVYDINGNYLYGYKEESEYANGSIVWREDDIVCIYSEYVYIIKKDGTFEAYEYEDNDEISAYSDRYERYYNGYTIKVTFNKVERIDEEGNSLVICKTNLPSDAARDAWGPWLVLIIFTLGIGFFVSGIIVSTKMRRKMYKKMREEKEKLNKT